MQSGYNLMNQGSPLGGLARPPPIDPVYDFCESHSKHWKIQVAGSTAETSRRMSFQHSSLRFAFGRNSMTRASIGKPRHFRHMTQPKEVMNTTRVAKASIHPVSANPISASINHPKSGSERWDGRSPFSRLSRRLQRRLRAVRQPHERSPTQTQLNKMFSPDDAPPTPAPFKAPDRRLNGDRPSHLNPNTRVRRPLFMPSSCR